MPSGHIAGFPQFSWPYECLPLLGICPPSASKVDLFYNAIRAQDRYWAPVPNFTVHTTNIIRDPLPQEMQPHTYPIMYRVEGSHWWFVGRRRILSSFVSRIVRNLNNPNPRILDVGCGTGANLEMLADFGDAEGVDVSTEALDFCQTRGLRMFGKGTEVFLTKTNFRSVKDSIY